MVHSRKDWKPGRPGPSYDPEVLFERLSIVAPSIAFDVDHELDPHYVWDGDGPDPRDEGYEAYSVRVEAWAIVGGEEVRGTDYLGGVYDVPDELDPSVHGYLLDMLQAALDDLDGRVIGVPLRREIGRARKYLKKASDDERKALDAYWERRRAE